jgi:hypothetical protein
MYHRCCTSAQRACSRRGATDAPCALQARRQDHLERARREEEAPLLTAAYNQRLQVRPPGLSA